MSSFARSFRHLQSDSPTRAVVATCVGALLLVLWAAWLSLARVPVRVASSEARIEAGAAAHSLDAPVFGRVISTSLVLGSEVRQGDELVRLEASGDQSGLTEERARLEGLVREVAALDAQMAAAEKALADDRSTTAVTVAEADARRSEAETAARLAAEELARAADLHAAGQLSDAALGRARSEAEAKRQSAESLRLGRDRTALQQRAAGSDRVAALEALRAELARRNGELATSRAAVGRLERVAGLQVITAPVSGRVASVAGAGVGSVVDAGAVLATIVPPGGLRLVAQFEPSVSLGRLRADQPARLRLDGFPWTQYGSVGARVTSVASEPRDALVRVELELMPDAAVPLEHGMTGRAEIEIERVTPLVLVLRAAGRVADRSARRHGDRVPTP